MAQRFHVIYRAAHFWRQEVALHIKSFAQKGLNHSSAKGGYMFSIEQTMPLLADSVYF